MSVQLIAWAYEQRTGSFTRKAVLLALANRANHDTGLCCPSLNRLAEETELHRATVIRALADLEEAGLVERVRRHRENGGKTSNEYRFPSSTVTPPRSQSATTPSRTVPPLEPEVRTRSKTSLPAAKKPRARNPVWDALTYVFGETTTPASTSRRAKVCAGLTRAGATKDQVVARASAWPAHFDTATLTETALEKHWDTLGRKPLRRTR